MLMLDMSPPLFSPGQRFRPGAFHSSDKWGSSEENDKEAEESKEEGDQVRTGNIMIYV